MRLQKTPKTLICQTVVQDNYSYNIYISETFFICIFSIMINENP